MERYCRLRAPTEARHLAKCGLRASLPSPLYPRSPTRPECTGRAGPAVASRIWASGRGTGPTSRLRSSAPEAIRRAWLAPSILENRARQSSHVHQPIGGKLAGAMPIPSLMALLGPGIGSMTSLGPLRHPQTTRNYWPKTGKMLVTVANIVGFICISADGQRDRSVWYSRLQMTSGSSFMPKSGRRGQYSSRERRVSLVRFVTRRSRHAFPMAARDIPSPLILESMAPDPGEHR